MMDGKEITPLVSIWCPTYNNKEYIRDAIEGFLAQKTTFSYEIVIHDDASTDGTTEILREYEREYPNLIKVIYQKENIFHRKDRRDILNDIMKKELKGKYVALCEGDDYWTNSNKLQMQVDYLETHEKCVMVVHNNLREDCETGEKSLQNDTTKSGVVSEKSIILFEEPTFQTASYVMLKEIAILEGFFKECGVGDYPMKLEALTKGYIYYFEDVMSVYRYKGKNSWTSQYHDVGTYQIIHFLQMIVFLKEYDKYTNDEYREWIKKRFRVLVFGILFILYRNEELYIEMLQDVIKEMDSRYQVYINKIAELYERGTHIDAQMPMLLDYCKKYKTIWIWGAGKVSERYSMVLEEAGVEIQGYIVTENSGINLFRGKKVWEIKDFPYDENETGIIIATNMYATYEIVSVMDEYNITNYYCNYETTLWGIE